MYTSTSGQYYHFLELSTVNDVTKYRGIPVSGISVAVYYYRRAFLDTAHHYTRAMARGTSTADDLALIRGVDTAASSADRENTAAWAARTLAGRWHM